MRNKRMATLALSAVAAGALSVAAGQSAHAQAPTTTAPQVSGVSDLADVRVEIVKAALQLTADQEKFWPAVEEAIRARAKNRQNRIAELTARLNEMRERTPLELLRDRDPISFLHRRADALSERATDLKKLADAWQPLYQTLSPDQRMRMAFLTIFVLRELRSGVEQRLLQSEDYE